MSAGKEEMDKLMFIDAMFQLADLWTDCTEAEAYILFLKASLANVCDVPP